MLDRSGFFCGAGSFRGPLRAVNRFGKAFIELYSSIDRRVLGVFRIAHGLVLFYDLIRRADVLSLMYSNEGVLSNHYLMFAPQSKEQFSLLVTLSTPNEVRVAFVAIALVYLLYTVGLFSTLARVLALVAITSLNSRNLFLEDSGVTTLIALGVWTLFLPLGDALSLDALRREARLDNLRQRAAQRKRVREPVVSLAVLALALQLVVIYWLSAAHKTGATWHDGHAVHYVLWQRRVATDFGFWLAQHEPSWFSPLATDGTLAIEWLLPLFALYPRGVWPRLVAFAGALALHGGIALVMALGPLSYAMLLLVGLRLPWSVFAATGRRVPNALRLRLARWRAQLLRWLARAPVTWASNHRPSSAALLRHPFRETLVIVLMYVAAVDLSQNNRALPWRLPFPRWARAVAYYPRFLQRWNMFAPDAPTDDGAGVVDAVTASGRHFDPFTGEAPDFDRFEHGVIDRGSVRADYLFWLHLPANRAYRWELDRYLREWHQHDGRTDADRIVRFQFWWLSTPSPPPGSTHVEPPTRELISKWP